MYALFLVPLALLAAGTELDAAQRAYTDVDYGRCREMATAALTQPATLDERTTAYRLLGLCAAAHGDTDAARDAFRMMLTIDGSARLPDGLSPRFTSSYREAKGSLVGAKPMALTVVKDDVAGASRTVRVRVTDPSDLLARVAFRPDGGALSAPLKKAVEIELEVPSAVAVEIVGLDKSGGELIIQTIAPVGAGSTGPDVLAGETQAQPEADGSPMVAVIVGGIAGAALLLGSGAVVLGVLLAPPTAVSLRTDVTFAER